MLKVAKSFEYAVLALKYIEENSQKDCINTKEISENAKIPYDLLAKILQKLVRKNLVYSIQGNRGGYKLNRESGNILLSEIVDAVDQKIQMTDCMLENPTVQDCSRVGDCCIRSPLSRIHDKVYNIFYSTTLKEIIN
ncbi:MAG: Rrf2 family transcriptional regulator [Melioribacteraceae bacterium]|nr:Rrf2 family transcriptional regulator [Melioribacteraceae bacterium]MCF8263943.1 Rrf2 family transcriptional regulator [Melioribacteraceae bacterium]MCF8432391.1 Rrf2 family transcriptional regulator [Melioribacteraceae bacterium]